MKYNVCVKLGSVILAASMLYGCSQMLRTDLPDKEDRIQASIEQQLQEKYGDTFTVEQVESEGASMAFQKATYKATVRSDRYPGEFSARLDRDMENLKDDYPRLYWNDAIESRVQSALDRVTGLSDTDWKVVYVLSDQTWTESDDLDEYLSEGDTYLDMNVTVPANLDEAVTVVDVLLDSLREEQLQYSVACSCGDSVVVLSEKSGRDPLTDERVYEKLAKGLEADAIGSA